jgi:transcription elongation GreA/GreB family factor
VSSLPAKTDLRDELARGLAADLETRQRAYRAAREAATHEEAKPENDKDTRALEQSYLARGEALRIEELTTALVEVKAMSLRAFREGEAVTLGALVTTETTEGDGADTPLWLAPHGGGLRLADGAVQVVTPRSPLGRAILGKKAGDECEVVIGGKTRALTIVLIR